MTKLLCSCFIFLFAVTAAAQGFEVSGIQENYKGNIGETIKATVRLRNTTDKTLTLIVKRTNAVIGSTQRSYMCVDNYCFDQKVDDFTLKLEAGQTFNTMQLILEGGLVSGESSIRYTIYNKSNPTEYVEFETSFTIEEKPEKQSIYNSKYITLHDVYPNPVSDYAFVDYKLLSDRVKARIVIHNILGSIIGEYNLPLQENRVKIHTEEFNSGIYFYTLYLDNEGVMTRKLIVKN